MERYNHFEFVSLIKTVCLQHPFVSNFYMHKYKLNTTNDIDYPAIVFTFSNSVTYNNITTINFNLLYVDRLTQERDNMLQIHSVGIDAVNEILNHIQNKNDIVFDGGISVNLFEEQFADNVAGAVATVQMQMMSNIGECDWIFKCEDC